MGDMGNGSSGPEGFMATARGAAPYLTLPAMGIAAILSAQGANAAERPDQAALDAFQAAWDNAIVTTVTDMREGWDDAVADIPPMREVERLPGVDGLPEVVTGPPEFNPEKFVATMMNLWITDEMDVYKAEERAYSYWFQSGADELTQADYEAIIAYVDANWHTYQSLSNQPRLWALQALESMAKTQLYLGFREIDMEDLEAALQSQWRGLEVQMTEMSRWLLTHEMNVYGFGDYQRMHRELKRDLEEAMKEGSYNYHLVGDGPSLLRQAVEAGRIESQDVVDGRLERHQARLIRVYERFLGFPQPEMPEED